MTAWPRMDATIILVTEIILMWAILFMNASELKKGESAKITLVEYSDLQNKLIEMGCFEGNAIKLLHVAPLGDPIAFDING